MKEGAEDGSTGDGAGVLDVEDVVKEERMEVGVELLAGGGRLQPAGEQPNWPQASISARCWRVTGVAMEEATRRRSQWRQRGRVEKPGVEVEEG